MNVGAGSATSMKLGLSGWVVALVVVALLAGCVAGAGLSELRAAGAGGGTGLWVANVKSWSVG